MNVQAPTKQMKSWAQTKYGGPETVVHSQQRIPVPGPTEVLVRVRATGLNAADARIMRGDPYLLRLGFGFRRPKQPVRGNDIAGVIAAIGSDVIDVKVGDEVVAETDGGGLAPFALIASSRLVRRPETVSPEAAAALPIAGGTAVQALDLASVAKGHNVLVIGASGGVGSFTVQLARKRGAEVWALCGARSQRLVEGLGAARTFDYRQTEVSSLPRGKFDAIIDIAGSTGLRTLRDLLAPGGTLVMVAGDGGAVLGPLPRILHATLLRKSEGRRIRPLAATAKTTVLRDLLALTAGGDIQPVIERTYSFDESVEALTRIDSGRVVGKIVVCVGSE